MVLNSYKAKTCKWMKQLIRVLDNQVLWYLHCLINLGTTKWHNILSKKF